MLLQQRSVVHSATMRRIFGMFAVVWLSVMVTCLQALKIESAAKSAGYRSPMDYLRKFSFFKQNHTNEWPYVPVKQGLPRQSPIDLITSKAVTRPLPTLEIVEPDMQGHQAKFYNSGHTVYVYMNDDPENRPQLKGGPLLNDNFYFEQMHFHWGNEDYWGSEHFIDGQSFAAEIHMVHWNSKYDNFTCASKQDDGLAVLTVFAENNNVTDNTLLKPLYTLLPNVSEPKTFVMLDTNDAMQWAISALTENTEYYTYPGSLTTEPYSENVVFILLPKPISLSCYQLKAFRTLHSSEGHDYITDNKRKLQPLHNRPIVRSTNMQS